LEEKRRVEKETNIEKESLDYLKYFHMFNNKPLFLSTKNQINKLEHLRDAPTRIQNV